MIRRLMDDYHIVYKERGNRHCREGWVQINCPFCIGGIPDFHMGYNLEREVGFNCYRCGFHSVAKTLSHLLGISGKEAYTLYRRYVGKGTAIEPLMYSVGGVSGKPKGAVTIAEYCEATGLIGWEVRYRARKNKLHKVPGRMLMYMKADLDRIMAEYAEQTTGEDGTRGKCTRCNELDVGMDCRGGLCLDCWSHDYCKRKGI